MDFNALTEYNDYLEMVEDIIFNLCEGIDVRATEARVEAYRREHAVEIARINQRNAADEERRVASRGVGGATVDTWAPRRMSNESAEETPGPSTAGGGGLRGFGVFGSGGFGTGYTPGTGDPHGQVLPVPTAPIPVPLSAGKGLEIGHGRHAHHGGWYGDDQSAEGLARREEAIAKACGVDTAALGRQRAMDEALGSVFC